MSERTYPELRASLYAAHARLRHSAEIVAQTAARPSRPPRKAQAIRVTSRPKPMLMLIVEDDAATGRLYREALADYHATVLICPTLAEARDAIEAAPFDVAIIDLMVPDDARGTLGNGATLIPLIRARSPETRIVVSTGLEDGTARDALLVAGVDPSSVEVVPKVEARTLRAVVAVGR